MNIEQLTGLLVNLEQNEHPKLDRPNFIGWNSFCNTNKMKEIVKIELKKFLNLIWEIYSFYMKITSILEHVVRKYVWSNYSCDYRHMYNVDKHMAFRRYETVYERPNLV